MPRNGTEPTESALAPSSAPPVWCSKSFSRRRLPCLLAWDGYARWALRAGTTDARVRRQLRDRALRGHVLRRIEGAADAGGNRARRGICSSGHGNGGLDRHAGACEVSIGLARVESDAYREPAHDFGEIP